MQKNIYLFIGTTAELIKLAPVLQELDKRKVDFKIIASGQNKLEFDYFKPLIGKQEIYYKQMIKQVNLPSFYASFIIWALKTFINFVLYFKSAPKGFNKNNTFFIVQGDTISSLIGALVAKILGLRLVHIESGLRSFNFFEPFPEELSRFIISKLADFHFCPNKWSVSNLKNATGIKVNTGQNTLYESCMQALKIKTNSRYLKRIRQKKYFLLILHRQEHLIYKKRLTRKYINTLTSLANPNLKCIFILHKLTEDFLKREGLLDKIRANPNVVTVPRLPYFEFMKILSEAEFIATDGGSNQEEAYYIGKPCLILRNVTERIEGLGENAVLAKEVDNNIIRNFVENYKKYKRRSPKISTPPSKIIVDYLMKSKLLS